jgi:hypothetical protein
MIPRHVLHTFGLSGKPQRLYGGSVATYRVANVVLKRIHKTIDFTPFWAPVDFALAMFANWVGPRQGDASVLRYFKDIAYFDQLLSEQRFACCWWFHIRQVLTVGNRRQRRERRRWCSLT